jgi:predicted secreted protein
MNGNNIIVYTSSNNGSSWTAIAATKSDKLQVSGETIEISSATDADWQHIIAGRKSWGLNVNWLVTQVADVRKALAVNTRVKIRIGGRSFAAASGLEGYAIITQCEMAFTRGTLATGSLQMKGDGPLT